VLFTESYWPRTKHISSPALILECSPEDFEEATESEALLVSYTVCEGNDDGNEVIYCPYEDPVIILHKASSNWIPAGRCDHEVLLGDLKPRQIICID
jgi:hypothetical protein